MLVHGTGEKKDETWSWSYEPALRGDGFATCSVQLPDHGLGDFAVAAEYIVAAVRKASRRAGHPVAVIGYSQGGALPVWAAKFWPDVADRVTDLISLGGPFDGTKLANEVCAPGRCAPLAWQLRRGADHIAALRNGPLPQGVPVTSIFTQYDEIVRPQPEASSLPAATNVMLQDALTHRGPARPARLPATTSQETFIPHGDAAGSHVYLQGMARFATFLTDQRRWVDSEPPGAGLRAPVGGVSRSPG